MIHSIFVPVHRTRACAASLAAAVLAACVTTPEPTPTSPPATLPARYASAAWSDLPGLATDRVGEAWPAFRAGCRVLLDQAATATAWRKPCVAAEAIDGRNDDAVRAFLSAHFSPYAVAFPDGRVTGLVTGYYEPMLAGSRVRTEQFKVPIFAPPDDLVVVDLATLHPELKDRRVRARIEGRRAVPYWSRREIEAGKAALAGKALAHVAEPIDAFFLQIQGSGRIELPDGSVMRVGYADQNGHPYRAVGRVLVERGELTLERSSMQAIREWGERNPDQLPTLLDENPSYVFFREVAPPPSGTPEAAIDGPPGALGVPLVPRRAVAVDPRAIPLGAPAWLATTFPQSGEPLQRLVLAQDTGGAIHGAVRADLFWGHGDEAGRDAGSMRQQGRLWLLWPIGVPLPGAAVP